MNHADTEEFKDREDSVINLTDCNQNIEIPPTQNMSACTNDNKKAAPQKSPTVSPKKQPTISTLFANNKEQHDRNSEWNCKICTYINEKPLALACGVCGSLRN
jgi:rubrerythrin